MSGGFATSGTLPPQLSGTVSFIANNWQAALPSIADMYLAYTDSTTVNVFGSKIGRRTLVNNAVTAGPLMADKKGTYYYIAVSWIWVSMIMIVRLVGNAGQQEWLSPLHCAAEAGLDLVSRAYCPRPDHRQSRQPVHQG